MKKGIYPYEYTDSFERFSEKKLPAKEAFYSQSITEEEYEHAKKVYGKHLGAKILVTITKCT